MFSLFSNPHLSSSLSAPALSLDSTEELPGAEEALAAALTSSGSISEPCSPTMAGSLDSGPSAFASAEAASLSPYQDTQRQPHDKTQGRKKAAAASAEPAEPSTPAAAAAPGRPPLGRSAVGGGSGMRRASGAHLKPHHVDAEWDPINVSWAKGGARGGCQTKPPPADLHPACPGLLNSDQPCGIAA